VAQIHAALVALNRGGPAADSVEEVKAALTAGIPPSAATTAGLLALQVLRLGEEYDLAVRLLDVALERARSEGHAARQGIIHGQRAAIALAQGSLNDAQVEAETGLLLVGERHFVVPQLLAVAMSVQIERGDLDTAAELSERGEAHGVAEDRTYVDMFLVARGRLRIAQGRVREGVQDLLWCGERLERLQVAWPSDWRSYAVPALVSLGDTARAAQLAREELAQARQVGARAALGRSLRTAAPAFDADERLALLQEAVSVLDDSAGRLELAYALADLGAELTRAHRRRDGRDAQ
jgi:hypothetical protein